MLLLFSAAAAGQTRIDWQAADASGAEKSMSSTQFLYTSTGQPSVGVSVGSGRMLHSGYLYIRAQPSGTPTIIAQSSLDFGNVIIGQNEVRQLTVSNGGALPLNITGTSISPAAFEIAAGGGAQTINPGGSATMTLRFTPSAAGAAAGSLVITSNASNAPTHTVSLSGAGVSAAPAISLSANTLDFGPVDLGSSAVRSVTVSNTGNAPLNVTGQTLGGTNAPDFVINHSSGTPIAPAGSDYIEIRFSPSAAGGRTAALTVTSNDPNFPSLTVSLSGSGTTGAQPHITVSQTTLDFGTTAPGTPVDRDLVISNTGSASLTINAQNVTGQSFALTSSAAGTIPAGGNATARLRFNPSSPGGYNGAFEISSNDPASPTVTVTLRGIGGSAAGPRIALGATVLDFGNVAVLQSKEMDLEVRNIGSSDLVISAQLIAGADALHFSITQAAASPVAAGGNTTVRIRHLPTSGGAKVAILRMITNDPGMPTAEIALISTAVGTGSPPEPPENVKMSANYPNPFTEATNIAYELGEAGEVELTVYDSHGRCVMSLSQGSREAGSYGVVLEPAKLPAGISAVGLRAALRSSGFVTRSMLMHCAR